MHFIDNSLKMKYLTNERKRELAEKISGIIQNAVKSSGMSAHIVSKKIGMHSGTLYNMMKEKERTPNYITLETIADAIGCELEIRFVPKDPKE